MHAYILIFFYLREDCNHYLIKDNVFKVQKQLWLSSNYILKLAKHF